MSTVSDIFEKLMSKENKNKIKYKIIFPLIKEISIEFQPYFFFFCGLYGAILILLIIIIIILIIQQRKISKL